MAKQLTFMQGDFGYVFYLKVKSDTGTAIKLNNKQIKLYVTKPDNKCFEVDSIHYFVSNSSEGIVRLIIPKEYTEEVGLYSFFISIEDKEKTYKINSQDSLTYYVMESHNGANCEH